MAKAYSEICENWGIDLKEYREDFDWLRADPRDEKGRLTRELGILKQGGDVVRMKRGYFPDGGFAAFYLLKDDSKFNGYVSVSKDDFYFDVQGIGGKIREAREAKGMTQAEVGRKMGYSPESNAQKYVAGWEAGVRPVPVVKIRSLADLLGLDVADLLP